LFEIVNLHATIPESYNIQQIWLIIVTLSY
jgi:hypothetical protein